MCYHESDITKNVQERKTQGHKIQISLNCKSKQSGKTKDIICQKMAIK